MTPLDARSARRVREYQRFVSWCVRRFLQQYRIPSHAAVDSADLHAEGIFALCRCAAEWTDAHPSFRAYVARAVHNRLLTVCGFSRRAAETPLLEMVSLDSPFDGELSWAEIVPSHAATPEEECVRHQLAHALASALGELRPQQQEVIRRRLAGDGTAEIARALSCSKARLATLERVAMLSLRPSLEAFRD